MRQIIFLYMLISSCTLFESQDESQLFKNRENIKNIFVYGTLALPEKQKELGLKCRSEIPYDYIKGWKLKEIHDGEIYLCAHKQENGIISGRVLIDCNFEQSLKKLDEWEGPHYTKYQTQTEVTKIKVLFYAESPSP